MKRLLLAIAALCGMAAVGLANTQFNMPASKLAEGTTIENVSCTAEVFYDGVSQGRIPANLVSFGGGPLMVKFVFGYDEMFNGPINDEGIDVRLGRLDVDVCGQIYHHYHGTNPADYETRRWIYNLGLPPFTLPTNMVMTNAPQFAACAEPPACGISVTSLDFGTTPPGTPVERTFTVTNTGGGTLSGSVTESCEAYSVSNGDYSLEGGASQTVTVTLLSASTGSFPCTLDTGGDCVDISLTGTVDFAPVCQVSESALDFGTVLPNTPVAHTFNISNTGGGTLSGSVTESCAAYSVSGGVYSLTAGQSQTVTVTFQSATAGSFPCTLDTGGDCADIALTGVVELAPACQLSATSLDFGTVLPDSSRTLTFSITNSGGGTLAGEVVESCQDYSVANGVYSLTAGQSQTVSVTLQTSVIGPHACTLDTGGACADISLSGVVDFAPACQVSESALDFGTVLPDTPVAHSFSISNTGGGTLSGSVTESCAAYSVSGGVYSLTAGQSQTVTVTFQSATAGSFPCTLDTGGDCADIALTGAVELAPACLLSATSLDFGNLLPDSSRTLSFSITNSGGGTLAGEVSEACNAYTVANGVYSLTAGQSQTISVTLQSAVSGDFPCLLDTGGACADLSLSGVVDANPPVCALDVDSLDFGTILPNTPTVRSFTITNNGGGVLAGSVTEACDQYSVENGVYSLGGGQSQQVSVTLQAAAPGSYPCVLDTGGECADFNLSGVVELAPACQVSETTIELGLLLPGQIATGEFSITNAGGGTLSGVATMDCPGFVFTGPVDYALTAGQSRTITFDFLSATPGEHSCEIAIGSGCTPVLVQAEVQVAPQCVVGASLLDFGTNLPNAPETLTFTISNAGGHTLSGQVAEDCAAYTVSNGVYSLGAGESQTVSVTFESAMPGDFPCSLDTGGDCDDITLAGTVDLAPACQLSTTAIDLGLLLPGEIANGGFSLTNSGGGTLSGDVTMECAGFVFTGPTAFSLTAGQSQGITFDFLSPTPGVFTCAINATAACGPVQVQAVVEAAPQCQVSASSLDFGTVQPNSPVELSFTLSNTGGHTLIGQLQEDCAAFQVVGAASYSLSAGQSQEFTIRFQAADQDEYSCLLDTGGSCADINLTAVVDPLPSCLVSVATLDFGTVLPGVAVTRDFSITNAGGGTLNGAVLESCAAYSVSDGAYSLTEGQSQTVTVTFQSAATGEFACNLDTGGSCEDISMTAVVELAPACQLSVTALDFGTTAPNTPVTRTFTVTNVGGGTLEGDVTESCAAYTVSNGTYSLGAGQSHVVSVVFQSATEGSFPCTLDTGGSCADLAMTVEVVLAPVCQLNVSALDFGTAAPNTPVTRNFSITNAGGGTLVGVMAESCAAYTVSNGTYSLGAGQSQMVSVVFQSATEGSFPCTLDTGGDCVDLPLTATVLMPPSCQLSVTSLDFGTVLPGTPVTRTFSITNAGGGTLSGTVSETCESFSVGNGVYNLAAGQSQSVSVTFQGATTGGFDCLLDTGGSCADLPLSAAVASVQVLTGSESACGTVDVLGHLPGADVGFVPDWENGQIGLHFGNVGGEPLTVSVLVGTQSVWSGAVSAANWLANSSGLDLSDYYGQDVELHFEVSDGQSIWNDNGAVCLWELGFVELEQAALPLAFRLHEATPNPFNPLTHLRLELPESDHVRVAVCDLQGRQVALLADRDLPAGNHELSWQPSQVASGTYFVVVQCRQGLQVRKVLFLK